MWGGCYESFFLLGICPWHPFFARGFPRGSRQNKSLTNKIWADLPAGKKKDSRGKRKRDA
jgi:hypothetical protein